MRIVIVAVLALTGCASGWKHPTATEADFNRDRYQCNVESASAYPTALAPMGAGYRTAGSVNCTTLGASTNCVGSPGVNVPAPVQDANALPRSIAFRQCMESRGWRR